MQQKAQMKWNEIKHVAVNRGEHRRRKKMCNENNENIISGQHFNSIM